MVRSMYSRDHPRSRQAGPHPADRNKARTSSPNTLDRGCHNRLKCLRLRLDNARPSGQRSRGRPHRRHARAPQAKYWLPWRGHKLCLADHVGQQAEQEEGPIGGVFSEMPPRHYGLPQTRLHIYPQLPMQPSTPPSDPTTHATLECNPVPSGTRPFAPWQSSSRPCFRQNGRRASARPSRRPRTQSIQPSHRCWITGYRMGTKECHIVPRNQETWSANNDNAALHAKYSCRL